MTCIQLLAHYPQRILSPLREEEKPGENATSQKRAAPGAARHGDNEGARELASFTAVLDGLPEAERSAVMDHVKALSELSPAKRAAILTLTRADV